MNDRKLFDYLHVSFHLYRLIVIAFSSFATVVTFFNIDLYI